MKYTENWYLLKFNARAFNVVFKYLKEKRISYVCPMTETLYRRPDHKNSFRKRIAPTFPGYFFIKINFNDCHTTKITSHQHIRYFVSFGRYNETKPIREEIVNELAEKPIHRQEKKVEESHLSEWDVIISIKNDDERIARLLEHLEKR